MPKTEVGRMGIGESGFLAPSSSLCSTCQDHRGRKAALLQPQASKAAAIHSGLLPKEPWATFVGEREYVGGKEGGAEKEKGAGEGEEGRRMKETEKKGQRYGKRKRERGKEGRREGERENKEKRKEEKEKRKEALCDRTQLSQKDPKGKLPVK